MVEKSDDPCDLENFAVLHDGTKAAPASIKPKRRYGHDPGFVLVPVRVKEQLKGMLPAVAAAIDVAEATGSAQRREWEAEEAAKYAECRRERRREREFLKAFLSNGERSRAEVYAAIAEAFPSYRPGHMYGFAAEWRGIAKRKEAGAWYWRLKSPGSSDERRAR